MTTNNDSNDSSSGSIDVKDPYDLFSILETPNSIRLIELHPSPESNTSLVATLIIVQLSEKPEYECLSYVWGSATKTQELHLRISHSPFEVRSTLGITENLATALTAFRLPEKKRTLWVDAICIDQNNKSEKAFQIPLMADIYSKASQVLIWLGEETEHAASSFQAVDVLVTAAERLGVGPRSQHMQLVRVKNTDWDNEEIKKLVETVQSSDFYHLWERPWFTRLWIVQEVVLATKATLVWGKHTLDWMAFETAMSMLYEALQHINSGISHANAFNQTWGIIEVKADHKIFSNGRVSVGDYWDEFGVFMFRLRRQSCTDDRDRVLALWGLHPSSISQWISLGGKLDFTPSYEKTAIEVYTDFAYAMLEKSHLNFFMTSGIWERLYTRTDIDQILADPFSPNFLPSWVPDFGNNMSNKPLPWVQGCAKFEAATARWPPWIKCGGNKRCIMMKGAFLDQISNLVTLGDYEVAVFSNNCSPTTVSKMVSLICQTLVSQNVKEIYGYTGEKIIDALARTLLADGATLPSSLELIPEFKKFLRTYLKDDESVSKLWEKSNYSRLLDAMGGGSPPGQPSEEFVRILGETLFGNVFFLTYKGLIGLGPPRTAIRDNVMVIDGDRLPCITRKIPGEHEFLKPENMDFFKSLFLLVGPCYAHSCMYGETAAESPHITRAFIPFV